MYQILKKQTLNANTKLMVIEAPHVARKAEPGQFIILRVSAEGERIPLTIADFDREKGSVTIIFQEVGATTMALGALNEGDCLHDFVGPLGKESELEGLKKVAVVGGGLGCAIAYPQAKKLRAYGRRSAVIEQLNKELRDKLYFHYHGIYVTDNFLVATYWFHTDVIRLDDVRYLSKNRVEERSGRELYRLTLSEPETDLFYEIDFREEELIDACVDAIRG